MTHNAKRCIIMVADVAGSDLIGAIWHPFRGLDGLKLKGCEAGFQCALLPLPSVVGSGFRALIFI